MGRLALGFFVIAKAYGCSSASKAVARRYLANPDLVSDTVYCVMLVIFAVTPLFLK
jgi:hypothetical protein